MVLSEPLLAVVGCSTLLFTLAASRIMAAQARRTLELHFLQVRAATLRNTYNRQVLALRSDTPPTAPSPLAPPAEAPEVHEPLARAA